MDDIFANKLLFILSMFINLLWKGMSNKINYIIQDNDKRNMPSLSKPGVNKQSLGVLDIWLNARGVKSKPPRWHINLPIAHSVRENVTYRVAIILWAQQIFITLIIMLSLVSMKIFIYIVPRLVMKSNIMTYSLLVMIYFEHEW